MNEFTKVMSMTLLEVISLINPKQQLATIMVVLIVIRIIVVVIIMITVKIVKGHLLECL